MKCKSCGHDNEVGMNFCSQCGGGLSESPTEEAAAVANEVAVNTVVEESPTVEATPVEAPPIEAPPIEAPPIEIANNNDNNNDNEEDDDDDDDEEENKAKLTKKILSIAIPVVFVACAVFAVIIALPMLKGLNTSKNNISLFTIPDESSIAVSGNNNSRFLIDGDIHSSQVSLDGSKAVVLTDYISDTGGTLWFVTTSGANFIADDVLSFQLADSGNGVAYFTDRDDEIAALLLYDTSSKKTTLISDEAVYGSGGVGVAISPDGKSIAYASDFDSSAEEFTGFMKIDGKAAEKLGNNTIAVAISNGGKHIYYIKMSDNYSGSLHVKSGRNETRLMSDMSSWNGASLMLNNDYSEVIVNIDGRAFISRKGSERERVSSSAIGSLLLPNNTQMKLSSVAVVFNVSSFANTLAVSSSGIEFINSKFESHRISGSGGGYLSKASVSSNGKSLLFINGRDTLVRINPTKESAEAIDIARDVVSFVASDDGQSVYYVNDEEELWFVKGSKKPTKVADFVSAERLAIFGNKAFFITDYSSHSGGDLQYSANGKKGVRIADDVSVVWSTATNVFYLTDESDVYRSNGNEKFTLFQEEARRSSFGASVWDY